MSDIKPVEITVDQFVKIRSCFNRMPYMGGMMPSNIRTADDVIDMLEAMVSKLRDISARHDVAEKELYRLQDQQLAVGQFLTDALAAAKPKQD